MSEVLLQTFVSPDSRIVKPSTLNFCFCLLLSSSTWKVSVRQYICICIDIYTYEGVCATIHMHMY